MFTLILIFIAGLLTTFVSYHKYGWRNRSTQVGLFVTLGVVALYAWIGLVLVLKENLYPVLFSVVTLIFLIYSFWKGFNKKANIVYVIAGGALLYLWIETS